MTTQPLHDLPGLDQPDHRVAQKPNDACFPVLVNEEAPIDRDGLLKRLREQGIVPRCSFHPLIPELQYYRSNARADPARYPVAARVARQVLCLPLYPDLAMPTAD